jgi:hypothetical protein
MGAYELLSMEPTIQVLSPEIVLDAKRITARALPSGIVFSVFYTAPPVTAPDRIEPDAARIARALAYWSDIWNANADVPGVLSIGMSQEVDAAGQLKDQVLVFVASTSGRSTDLVTLGPRNFMQPLFGEAVAASRARMDAIEATGPLVDESGLSASGAFVELG